MRISNIKPCNHNQHTFTKLFKKKAENPEQNETQKKNTATKAILMATAISGAVVANAGKIPPNNAIMPYNEGITDLAQVAQVFGVDEDSIKISDSGLSMIIPKKFDYLEEKIKTEREKMYHEAALFSQTFIRSRYKTIQQLLEKQEYQKHIATMTTDDEFVYFAIFPDENQKDSFISIEDFKKVFDIEDGALSKIEENGILDDVTGEYFADGSEYLTSGTQLKVKVSAINTHDINFDYK